MLETIELENVIPPPPSKKLANFSTDLEVCLKIEFLCSGSGN